MTIEMLTELEFRKIYVKEGQENKLPLVKYQDGVAYLGEVGADRQLIIELRSDQNSTDPRTSMIASDLKYQMMETADFLGANVVVISEYCNPAVSDHSAGVGPYAIAGYAFSVKAMDVRPKERRITRRQLLGLA